MGSIAIAGDTSGSVTLTVPAVAGNNTLILPATSATIDIFPVGTTIIFQQTSAPTGWTKITTNNNAALRIVSGAAGTGGISDFTTAFSNRTVTGTTSSTAAGGTVGATTLTTTQIPAHGHTFSGSTGTISADHTHFDSGHTHTYATVTGSGAIAAAQPGFTLGTFNTGTSFAALGGVSANHVHAYSGTTANAGSGGSHDHTFTGALHNHTISGNLDLNVKYVDVIAASKD